MINLVLKIQEHPTLLKLYRLVSSSIQVIPYYIMEEFSFNEQNIPNVPLEKEDYKIDVLTRNDMEFLGKHEERSASTEGFMRLLDSGCICLAARYNGEIAAYSWCDLNHLKYKGRIIPLKPNEAYLFDARTYKAFRGKNLAPYVRNELCKLLQQRGIDRFISVTLWSNTASMSFKRKLGAKPIELFLYVGLFKKFHMHFRLRKISDTL